jgi:hypothetical protein
MMQHGKKWNQKNSENPSQENGADWWRMWTTWAPSSVNMPQLVTTLETIVFKVKVECDSGRTENKKEAKITTKRIL